MSKLIQKSFGTAEELAAAAAKWWVERLREKTSRAPYGVALSGGRIAKLFFQQVVKHGESAGIGWEHVHFFWADERCVPPTSTESNFWDAAQWLIDPLQLPHENIHRLFGEADPEYAAQQAEAELCRIMPMNDSGQPVLDLVFLGMGEDGHVASLFPEENREFVTNGRVFRPVMATKPPPQRITIGYQTLFAAREVAILASGKGKAAALAKVKEGDLSIPAARVVANRPETILFEDISGSSSGREKII